MIRNRLDFKKLEKWLALHGLKALVVLALLSVGVIVRVWSDVPNLSPWFAICLFLGFWITSRWLGVALIFGGLFISDLWLGFYDLMPVVYGSFLAIALMGSLLQRTESHRSLMIQSALLGVGGSLFFFVSSNFGVWAFTSYYAKNWSGLLECYLAAIPFLKWSLMGDLFFTTLLFSGFVKLRSMGLVSAKKRLA
jgi:hypothetical protein